MIVKLSLPLPAPDPAFVLNSRTYLEKSNKMHLCGFLSDSVLK